MCQKVLDLLDLMFAELFTEHLETQTPSGLSQLPLNSPYTLMVILIKVDFSSNKEGKLMHKLSGFYGIFQISPGSALPKPRYPSHANTRDKESLNSSTQAKLEEWLEEQHRQGAAVQPYPVIT